MRQLKYAIVFALLLVCLLPFSVLAAPSPHFVQSSASGPDETGNLGVNFKVAGLGDNVSITVMASASATAVYACRNNGGGFPSDAKKTTTSGPVSASGTFTSGQNGQVTSNLRLGPPPANPVPQCGAGQHIVLLSISYTDVHVAIPGDNESIPGTFSRTFFVVK